MRCKLQTVNYKNLMDLGFPEHTARDIIRHAKKIATNEYNERMMSTSKKSKKMIEYPCSPFDNPRVGIAPTTIVEHLLGFALDNREEEN
jgi:hypothetical protein